VTRPSFRIVLPLLLSALLTSCAPPATVPLKTVDLSIHAGGEQQSLIVFLPGIWDRPEVFAREGLVATARAHGVTADMIGADAHIGYYTERTFLPRFREDVILPARQRGYREIWLVGVSLGGFGAIWYDLEHPGELAGIVALAPYLGEPDMVDEVFTAGGLIAWQPVTAEADDPQRQIWRNLKRYARGEQTRDRIFLGYGRDDKFALPDGMLAAVLPSEQVITGDGGHDWDTWRTLWDRILLRLPLADSHREKPPATPGPDGRSGRPGD
jgi:pimeloyl-ACP methyl ester carboxylesterase